MVKESFVTEEIMKKKGRPPKAAVAKAAPVSAKSNGEEEAKDAPPPKLKGVLKDSAFDSRDLYRIYRVTIRMREHLRGGVPKNPELIRSWITSGTGHSDEKTEEQIAEVEAAVEAAAEKSWCGFMGDSNGLFIQSRQIKAMMKECASILNMFGAQHRGTKNVFQHAFEIKPVGDHRSNRIYMMKLPPDDLDPDVDDGSGPDLHDDDEGWGEPDGTDEKPIHVVTRQGPRTAIKRTDYVTRPVVAFEIWILKTHPAESRHVSTEDFVKMFKLAKENGLGAERSQGHGKFDIMSFEQVQ
ncbi:MAG: hypothetical protein ACYTEQ_05325 [Planctomycetota bacterium]